MLRILAHGIALKKKKKKMRSTACQLFLSLGIPCSLTNYQSFLYFAAHYHIPVHYFVY